MKAADTYVTVNPNGSISFNFTGVINALGLTIAAGNTATPPTQNRIQWTRADGGVVADIFGSQPGSTDELIMSAYGLDPGDNATVDLVASGNSGAFQSLLLASASDTSAIISAQASPGASARITDDIGNSSFVHAPVVNGTKNARIYGPFLTIGVSVPAGSDSPLTFTHNLNFTAQQQSNLVTMHNFMDGAFSGFCGARLDPTLITANQVGWRVGNPFTTNATVTLRFYIMTTT